MNVLQGLNLFDLSRFLFVFGFTLAVIRYTANVTHFDSPRAENRGKLRNFGIVSIVAGIAVAFVGASSLLQSEMTAIRGTGTDIIAIGFSCIVQCQFSTKKQHAPLKWGAYGVILLGLVVGIIAALAEIYKWF